MAQDITLTASEQVLCEACGELVGLQFYAQGAEWLIFKDDFVTYRESAVYTGPYFCSEECERKTRV